MKLEIVKKPRTGRPRKYPTYILETGFVEAIIGTLKKYERVYLKGFGVFYIKHRTKRKLCDNLRTGKTGMLPPRKLMFFMPDKKIKALIKK